MVRVGVRSKRAALVILETLIKQEPSAEATQPSTDAASAITAEVEAALERGAAASMMSRSIDRFRRLVPKRELAKIEARHAEAVSKNSED